VEKRKSKAKTKDFSKKAQLRDWDDIDQEGYITEEDITVDEEIEELAEEFSQLAGPSNTTHAPPMAAPQQLTPDQINTLLQGLIHQVGVLTHNTNTLVAQIQNQATN